MILNAASQSPPVDGFLSGGALLCAQSNAILGVSPALLYPLVGFLVVLVAVVWLSKIPFGYNVRNLLVRWKTTVMTALAFTLVVSLLTVMLAFVNGMNRLTEGSGQPGNVIVLSEGATDETFSNLGFSDTGDIANQSGVLRAGDEPLCSRETYIVVSQVVASDDLGRTKRRFLQIRGLDDPGISSRVHALELFPGGRWFSQAGVAEMAGAGDASPVIEAVLGEGVARELGRDRSPQQLAQARNRQRLDVGDTFFLGDRTWQVVGIMQSSGSTFDSEVWAKRSVAASMFGKETYTSLVLRTQDAAEAQKLKDFFNNEYEKAALNAKVETEYFASLANTNAQFLVAIIFVAVVMAIGGMFGVMNTMFAAISQRTKDIGVLRLLGFSRRQILVSFLLESILIALVGGALGCLLGYAANGWSATSIVSSGPGGGKSVVLKMAVDANTIAVGMLFTVAMGALGGFLPAVSAVRLRALDALR